MESTPFFPKSKGQVNRVEAPRACDAHRPPHMVSRGVCGVCNICKRYPPPDNCDGYHIGYGKVGKRGEVALEGLLYKTTYVLQFAMCRCVYICTKNK
jgi:hypothetical protein